MTERLVRVKVDETVKEVVSSAVKELTTDTRPKNIPSNNRAEQHKFLIEGMLRGVATRIVLVHSFKDLRNTLDGALTKIKSTPLDASQLDVLKGGVVDAVKRIKDGREGEVVARFLEDKFRVGKYDEVVEMLGKMADDDETGFNDLEKQEIKGLLSRVKPESGTSDEEMVEMGNTNKNLKDVNNLVQADIVEKSDKVQSELSSKEIEILVTQKIEVEDVPTSIIITDDRRHKLEQDRQPTTLSKSDSNFIIKVLIGDPGTSDTDFLKLDRKMVYHIWYRTSGILNSSHDWSSSPETKKILQEMNASSRRALLEFAQENLVLEGMTPSEARWLKLPEDERRRIEGDLDFISSTRGDYRELLSFADSRSGNEYAARGLERELTTRTDVAMLQLLKEYAKKKPNFELDKKLVRNNDTGKWEWFGTREELFDVARDEVYGIQGQLTQENMSNLVFEESAQKYLGLMRIDVGDNLELESVKDAITKTLYIEFAVKTMWRSGGNMEAWQRAAMVLTQDSETSFFELMKIGEMLKLKTKEGKELEVGRFDWKDLMTLAEMKASNGQYYLTFLAGQSQHLRKERKPEFVAALADAIINKRLLRGEITSSQAREMMTQAETGGFQFTDRQIRAVVDYMQFLEVSTFRGGEFGLNDSIVEGKFNMTSLPCGEVVQKTGPWSVVYDWYYPVTKYGGEWVGKLFLPNVNILSYRRGETVGHFIAKDSKVAAGILDKTGEFLDTGIGANEFFFEASHIKDANNFTDFWGDIIFDTRTGGVSNKTAINRTMFTAREVGKKKLAGWKASGRLGFVNNMSFVNFEAMIGYQVPGENNMEKFEWIVSNFSYDFWRTDVMPSKAIGDWVTKYVPKKYEDSRVKLAAFLNAPGTATGGAVRDNISEYSSEDTFNEQMQWVIKENRKKTLGLRMVDNNGVEVGTPGYDSSTGRYRLVGYKHADRSKSKWIQEGSGDFYEVTQQWHSPVEGFHIGSGLATSRQQGKELFEDPMYFEKMEIDNQFHNGLLSREEWGKEKRNWQKKAYLGDVVWESEDGKFNFRWGYIPILTPAYLFRGWWVDRMQLDWEDFLIATRKNNEQAWERLKKIIGI